ncbi:hypothetical protein H4R33_002546 [Dimargaris cristalligena]|nr:hypothetical protein H4R33_002546 [Dimargaris cristalligena]
MKLLALGFLAMAVPTVFGASLGDMPLNYNPSTACSRMDCGNCGPWIQESRAIIRMSNANCKVVKAALEEFVRDKITQTDRSAHSGADCTSYQNKLPDYLRAKLLPQDYQNEATKSNQPSQSSVPRLYRRMPARDCAPNCSRISLIDDKFNSTALLARNVCFNHSSLPTCTMVKFITVALLATLSVIAVSAMPQHWDGTCSVAKPCANGTCCSGFGSCGSTDAHCGFGCQSGPCKGAPTPASPNLPPNGSGSCNASTPCQSGACCSKQGFCGFTNAHCGTGCLSGPCGQVFNRRSSPKLNKL